MDIWQILGVSGGVVLGLAGLWLLRWGKRAIAGEGGDPGPADAGGGGPHTPEDEGLSGPTRLTMGVTCLLIGYHLIGWSIPALHFVVPITLWWAVVGGGVLAVGAAFAVDVLERGRA